MMTRLVINNSHETMNKKLIKIIDKIRNKTLVLMVINKIYWIFTISMSTTL